MTIDLKPEQENLVAEALRSGAYRSKEDVIDRALEILRQQDEWLTANREGVDRKIRDGIAQLERGDSIPEDQLDAFMASVKAHED